MEKDSAGFVSEIIALAWADEVSFDAIERVHGLPEKDVIALMRSNLKPGSYRAWRKRVTGRKAKHEKPSGRISSEE
jgi:uncharacterized protein (TIGR03643 family)